MGEDVPFAHLVHALLPAPEYLPAAQLTHDVVEAAIVPAAQEKQVEPSFGFTVPAPQSAQSVDPVADDFPAAQFEHEVRPSSEAPVYFPAGHFVQTVDEVSW
jgi:hypothetical protein